MRLNLSRAISALWVANAALASVAKASGEESPEELARRDDTSTTLEADEHESRGLHFGLSALLQAGPSIPGAGPVVGGTVAAIANFRWPSVDLRASLGFFPLAAWGRSATATISLGGTVELESFFRLASRYKLGVGVRVGVLATNLRSQCINASCMVPSLPTPLFGLKTTPVTVVLGEQRNIEVGFLVSFDGVASVSAILSDGSRYIFSGGFFVTTGVQIAFLVF